MTNVPQVRTRLLLKELSSDSHLLCCLRVPSCAFGICAVWEELAPIIFFINFWSPDRVIKLAHFVCAILSISTVTCLMDAPTLISSGAVWPLAANLCRVEERTAAVLISASVPVLTLWLVYIRCGRGWVPQWTSILSVLAREPILTLLFLSRCHLGILCAKSVLSIPIFDRCLLALFTLLFAGIVVLLPDLVFGGIELNRHINWVSPMSLVHRHHYDDLLLGHIRNAVF